MSLVRHSTDMRRTQAKALAMSKSRKTKGRLKFARSQMLLQLIVSVQGVEEVSEVEGTLEEGAQQEAEEAHSIEGAQGAEVAPLAEAAQEDVVIQEVVAEAQEDVEGQEAHSEVVIDLNHY